MARGRLRLILFVKRQTIRVETRVEDIRARVTQTCREHVTGGPRYQLIVGCAEVWVKSARSLCATIIYAPLKPWMFAARLTTRYSSPMMGIGAQRVYACAITPRITMGRETNSVASLLSWFPEIKFRKLIRSRIRSFSSYLTKFNPSLRRSINSFLVTFKFIFW